MAAPLVTGCGPMSGQPGCKVTVRGENLGQNADDFDKIFICDYNCTLWAEWISPNKIVARCGQMKPGSGQIVVITKSGGMGKSTVEFIVEAVQCGAWTSSCVWVESDRVSAPALVERPKNSARNTGFEADNVLGLPPDKITTASDVQVKAWWPEVTGSVDIKSPHFSAIRYLLTYHQANKHEELKFGLEHLCKQLRVESAEPRDMLRANLGAVLTSLEQLTELQHHLHKDHTTSSATVELEDDFGSKKLRDTLFEAKNIANHLFLSVLNRKDDTDAHRSAISIMSRYNFLFELPGSIDAKIQAHDYNSVINDYLRARAVYSNTDVKVFRKMYSEVERRIALLQNVLKERLLKFPSNFEDQKNHIRLLTLLEVNYDPGWECVKAQKRWVCEKLRQIFKENGGQHNDDSNLNHVPSINVNGDKSASVVAPPTKVVCADALCVSFSYQLMELWRLGQAYVGDTLLPRECSQRPLPDSSRNVQWHQMVEEVVHIFVSLYEKCVLQEAISLALDQCGWFPHHVRTLRDVLAALPPLSELPKVAAHELDTLCARLRRRCVVILLENVRRVLGNLGERETWVLEHQTNAKGVACTRLPLRAESHLVETFRQVQDVVLPQSSREAHLLEHDAEARAETVRVAVAVLTALPLCLETLVHSVMSTETSSTFSLAQQEHRLSLLLANCAILVDDVIPRVLEAAQRAGLPECRTGGHLESVAQRDCARVHAVLLEQLVDLKAAQVFGPLEERMSAGQFKWSRALPPRAPRAYAKELVCTLAATHVQLTAAAASRPELARRALATVIGRTLEEWRRCLGSVAVWCRAGRLQAYLDLRLLDTCLEPLIMEPVTRQQLSELYELISKDNGGKVTLTLEPEEKREIERILKLEKERFLVV